MQELERLREIVIQLRDPDSGCPWDIEQTFETIAPHTIEEAYEVADAIGRGDMDGLKLELGDLLLQVVFHARMAEEQRYFSLNDVCEGISDKLVSRHPHVFADASADTADEVLQNWEGIKAAERQANELHGLLDDVPRNLPALLRAHKLQKRAARVGMDWQEPEYVLGKLLQEVEELCEVMATQRQQTSRLAEELGDLLFTSVNLSRHLKLDAEELLRGANAKFESRIRKMESLAAEKHSTLSELSAEQLDGLWEESKRLLTACEPDHMDAVPG